MSQRLTDADCDPELIRGKRVTVFGFGSQGRAQAANLKDSGVDVRVALREGSAHRRDVAAAGLEVCSPVVGAECDVAVLLVPDRAQPELYREVLDDALPRRAALVFAHGYCVHHRQIEAREDLDVLMVAPLGIGEQVRAQFLAGRGVPGLVAVDRDATGEAWALASSYAWAQGHGRAAILSSSFAEETEIDLFAEQAVLVGGLTHLIRAGYDTLVEAGYPPELAYLSCVNEVKLIADLIYERGIAGMQASISDVAAYGAHRAGPELVGEPTRAAMAKILEDVRSGAFAEALAAADDGELAAARESVETGEMAETGERLRRLVDDEG